MTFMGSVLWFVGLLVSYFLLREFKENEAHIEADSQSPVENSLTVPAIPIQYILAILPCFEPSVIFSQAQGGHWVISDHFHVAVAAEGLASIGLFFWVIAFLYCQAGAQLAYTQGVRSLPSRQHSGCGRAEFCVLRAGCKAARRVLTSCSEGKRGKVGGENRAEKIKGKRIGNREEEIKGKQGRKRKKAWPLGPETHGH